MTLGEHAMIGALASFLGPHHRWGWRGTVMMTVAACVPDIDAVFWLTHDLDSYGQVHRAITHGVPGLMLLSLGLTAFWRWAVGLETFGRVLVWNLLAGATHVLADTLYGWPPVRFFWPFSDWGWYTDLLRFGDLFALGLLVGGCVWAWRRPDRGRTASAVCLGALVVYVLLRACLPDPEFGPWRFITGAWTDPVYEGVRAIL